MLASTTVTMNWKNIIQIPFQNVYLDKDIKRAFEIDPSNHKPIHFLGLLNQGIHKYENPNNCASCLQVFLNNRSLINRKLMKLFAYLSATSNNILSNLAKNK